MEDPFLNLKGALLQLRVDVDEAMKELDRLKKWNDEDSEKYRRMMNELAEKLSGHKRG